jgi:hypothetical protein
MHIIAETSAAAVYCIIIYFSMVLSLVQIGDGN